MFFATGIVEYENFSHFQNPLAFHSWGSVFIVVALPRWEVLFGGKVFLWGPHRTFRGATRIINATWHECRTFWFSLSRRRFKLHWNFCLRFSFEPPQKSESKLGRITTRMQLNNWRAFVDRSMFVRLFVNLLNIILWTSINEIQCRVCFL